MKKEKKIINILIKEFVEKGAAIEHDRWSRWQTYLHSKCHKNEDGSLTIPSELVVGAISLIKTPYSELTEELKESDRKETRNYLPLLSSALTRVYNAAVEDCIEVVKTQFPFYGGGLTVRDITIDELEKLKTNEEDKEI